VPAQGTDCTIRGAYLRWFLLEALVSNVASVAHIEFERATFTGAPNLEARTVNVLLRFVECTFEQMIEMSDATIVGFDMVGGSAKGHQKTRSRESGGVNRSWLKSSIGVILRRARGRFPRPMSSRLRELLLHMDTDAEELDALEKVVIGLPRVAEHLFHSPGRQRTSIGGRGEGSSESRSMIGAPGL
jgi:hypothetical protein